MVRTLIFYKENDKWYADVSGHTKDENEMVLGADDALEILSRGKNGVALLVTDDPDDADDDEPKLVYIRTEHDDDGATYTLLYSMMADAIKEIWLCNVMHTVFGEHPMSLYVLDMVAGVETTHRETPA